MQIGVNRSLAPRNGRPKNPFLLFEFNKMLVMKNHHDRVSQRDSKQRDKTDHREPPKRIKIALQGMSLLFRSCFSLWKLNQKDHKAVLEPSRTDGAAGMPEKPSLVIRKKW
jgi:hypothetical protein